MPDSSPVVEEKTTIHHPKMRPYRQYESVVRHPYRVYLLTVRGFFSKPQRVFDSLNKAKSAAEEISKRKISWNYSVIDTVPTWKSKAKIDIYYAELYIEEKVVE